MLDKLKTRYQKFVNNSRFSQNMSKRKQKALEQETKLQFDLVHPEHEQQYRKALRTLAVRQTGINFRAFGKWLITDLAWIVPPYLAFGWYQMVLNNTLLSDKVTSKMLWGVQQQLLLGAIITGALVIISGLGIVKNGWFHKPYKKGSLKNEMTQSLNRNKGGKK